VTERSATRNELEEVARRLVGRTDTLSDDLGQSAKIAVPALGVLAALGAYLWGRRRGRQRTTIVEVRRSK
jgi:hypothetical protein